MTEPKKPSEKEIYQQLSTVLDPEIQRPITELGMVKSLSVSESADVTIEVLLTVAFCPMRDTIASAVEKAAATVRGVRKVQVSLSAMNAQERAAFGTKLRGSSSPRSIPFNAPDNLTKTYAVVSGKGGVGKSTVTVNVAAALKERGLRVGIVDADIYGFSIPSLLGITAKPVRTAGLIIPPVSQGIKAISMGMFVDNTSSAIAWRGPRLHRALEQFLADVYFGDLDVLLLDLPPGTGDIALSVSQLLPRSELLVVTTPQQIAAGVAERAGSITSHTKQRIAGVIENMSALRMPDGSAVEVFGSGGGQELAQKLSTAFQYDVPLLASIPLDIAIRERSDEGLPFVLNGNNSVAAREFRAIASALALSPRNLSHKKLSISPRS